MTRRKDTLRNRTERIRIAQQKRDSRLEIRKRENRENEKEKLQEKQLLLQVSELPNELIRLVYDFMSGKAKMMFFPKNESLNRVFCPFDFEMGLNRLFKNMSNTQILDLIYTGTLLKYPEIISGISYDYYYSLIDQDFHTVYGYALMNLWSSGKLSYDFVQGDYSMDASVQKVVDGRMRERIAAAMKTYIWNTLHEYSNVHRQVSYLTSHPRTSSSNHDKKTTGSYRDLFLRMEKVLYLFRVASQFLPEPELVLQMHTDFSVEYEYTFTNEILIPIPLSLPIQT